MPKPKERKRGSARPRTPVSAHPEAKQRKRRPTVFISYSQPDERWKRRLVTQLEALQLKNLDLWDDGRIQPGADWFPAIRAAVETARVAVLLISADSLASKFIRRKEVPPLLRRRKREGLQVFPVIARPCPWKKIKWLAKMQVRPKNGRALSECKKAEAEAHLRDVAEEIHDLLKAKRPARGKARPKAPSGGKTARRSVRTPPALSP